MATSASDALDDDLDDPDDLSPALAASPAGSPSSSPIASLPPSPAASPPPSPSGSPPSSPSTLATATAPHTFIPVIQTAQQRQPDPRDLDVAVLPDLPVAAAKFNPRAIFLSADVFKIEPQRQLIPGQNVAEPTVAPGHDTFDKLGKLMPRYARAHQPDDTDAGFQKIPWTVPWYDDTVRFVGGLWLYRFCVQYASMWRPQTALAGRKKLAAHLDNQWGYFNLVHRAYVAHIEQRAAAWLDDAIDQSRKSPKLLVLLDGEIRKFARTFSHSADQDADRQRAQTLDEQNRQLRDQLDDLLGSAPTDMDTDVEERALLFKQEQAALRELADRQAAQHRQRMFSLLVPGRFVVDTLATLRDMPPPGRSVIEVPPPPSALTSWMARGQLARLVPSNATIELMHDLRDLKPRVQLTTLQGGAAAAAVAPAIDDAALAQIVQIAEMWPSAELAAGLGY
jgi:hypothetical protein